MRGTLTAIAERRQAAGLIPTYAGNTLAWAWRRARTRAHPHVCGEHRRRLRRLAWLVGSSPRMRGTLREIRALSPGRGVIPTCVGSTQAQTRSCCIRSAHPHVCGEHTDISLHTSLLRGSSPRVWGALARTPQERRRRRLIPTCVGSTLVQRFSTLSRSAHPHVCGEHIMKSHAGLT